MGLGHISIIFLICSVGTVDIVPSELGYMKGLLNIVCVCACAIVLCS